MDKERAVVEQQINQKIDQRIQNWWTSQGLPEIKKLMNESSASSSQAPWINQETEEKIGNLEQQYATLQQQLNQKMPEVRKEGIKIGEATRGTIEQLFRDIDAAAEKLGIMDTWLKLTEEAGIYRRERIEKQGGDSEIITVGW